MQGPRTHGRVGCKAHHRECEHSRCGEAVGGVERSAAPLPPVDAETEEKVAQLQGQLEFAKPVLAEGPGRFRSQSRGRVSGVDRSREDQQHHGPCSTTVATRSRSWDDAMDGDEHYGLRGVNRTWAQSKPAMSDGCRVCWWTVKRARSTRALWWTQPTIHWREAEFGIIGSAVEKSASKCCGTMKFHTRRVPAALRDVGIASFISEADPTQLDPSDCHSWMEQRGPDEVSAGVKYKFIKTTFIKKIFHRNPHS